MEMKIILVLKKWMMMTMMMTGKNKQEKTNKQITRTTTT
jgi:hypothetical protein